MTLFQKGIHMITKVKFGKCLQLLLDSLNISGNRLSKEINVDSSLISRWIHEQRIPPYHSNYIDSIATSLSQHILNSIQEENLNAVTNIVCGNISTDLSTKDRIMKALLEAQGRSLEGKKKETAQKKILLNPIKKINLSKEDNNIIIGRKNVLDAMLS